MTTKTILEKTYSDEDLLDIEEDIISAIEQANFKTDEHGFHAGSFKVTVVYTDD